MCDILESIRALMNQRKATNSHQVSFAIKRLLRRLSRHTGYAAAHGSLSRATCRVPTGIHPHFAHHLSCIIPTLSMQIDPSDSAQSALFN
jgi:hypothetical protein